MSDDYSNFERDYFTRAKRSQESLSYKYSTKEYKVYEPKSSQKTLKDREYADESQYSPPYKQKYRSHIHTDPKDGKRDTYKVYVSKNKANQEENNKFTRWKKKTVKVNKVFVESHKKAQNSQGGHEKNTQKRNLSAEDKQVDLLANHFSGKTSPRTSNKDSLSVTSDELKFTDGFDFSSGKPDPIKMLRNALKQEGHTESNNTTKSSTIKEEKDVEEKEPNPLEEKYSQEILFDIANSRNNTLLEDREKTHRTIEEILDEKIGNAQGSDRINLTNIYTMIEKISHNEEANFDDDGLAKLIRKKELETLEKDERLLWEDIEIIKMLDDEKKNEHIASQGKNLLWGDQHNEVPKYNMSPKYMQDEQPIRKKIENSNFEVYKDDNDEDFEKIFSAKPPIQDLNRSFPLSSGFPCYKEIFDKEYEDPIINKHLSTPNQRLHAGVALKRSTSSLPVFQANKVQNSKDSLDNLPVSVVHSSNFDTPHQHSQKENSGSSTSIFKNFPLNYDAPVWFYLDNQNVIQGPYSGRLMDAWCSKGYLPFDLNVTIRGGSGFRTLRELAVIGSKDTNVAATGSYSNNNFYSNEQNCSSIMQAKSLSQTDKSQQKQYPHNGVGDQISSALNFWMNNNSLNEEGFSSHHNPTKFDFLQYDHNFLNIAPQRDANPSIDSKRKDSQNNFQDAKRLIPENLNKHHAVFNPYYNSNHRHDGNRDERALIMDLRGNTQIKKNGNLYENNSNQKNGFQNISSVNFLINQENNSFYLNNSDINNIKLSNMADPANSLQDSSKINYRHQTNFPQFAFPSNQSIPLATSSRIKIEQQTKNYPSINQLQGFAWKAFASEDFNKLDQKPNQLRSLPR